MYGIVAVRKQDNSYVQCKAIKYYINQNRAFVPLCANYFSHKGTKARFDCFTCP
jgi:hypothetical protein